MNVTKVFAEAANLCCNKFISDKTHTEVSPLIHGPCIVCIKETVGGMKEEI